MGLTAEQEKVVQSEARVNVVVACPGSGKTSTIVEKVCGLSPDEKTLMLAFNKEAAGVLESRLVARGVEHVKCQTLHGYAMGWTMKAWRSMGFTQKPSLETEPSYLKGVADTLGVYIKSYESRMIDYDSFHEYNRGMYDSEVNRVLEVPFNLAWDDLKKTKWRTVEAVQAWRKYMMKNNIITFDSMVRLLAQNKYLLANNHYENVYVDEFQDITRFDFEIIQGITKSRYLKQLTVVGDNKQRINDWRGALRNSFVKMQAMNDDSMEFPLSINFRSRDGIIDYAETIFKVGMIGIRGERDPRSVEISVGDGENRKKAFALLTGPDFLYSESAVLCRYNKEVYEVAMRLVKERVPVWIMRAPNEKDFWDLPQIKIALRLRQRLGSADVDDLNFCDEWRKYIMAPRFQDSEELRAEVTRDAVWVLGLPNSDLELMKSFIQNPSGICISTVHRVKGKEWDQVLVYNEAAMAAEPCVRYVAVTRPRERLIIN